MTTTTTAQIVQWQDFTFKGELDIVFEIAMQQGWKDCEIFGYGEMITQPIELKGWKLIPADLYEYSIPAVGVARVLQIINAGVRVQGIIIADDTRKPAKAPRPARTNQEDASIGMVFEFTVNSVMFLIMAAFAILFSPLLLLGLVFDPKLIVLVEDKNGKTVWISLLTWFD